jgi:hypothetical protein
MTVDIIVCPQDDLCLSKGGIAKAISKVSNELYRVAVVGMKRVSKCEVGKIKASYSSHFQQHTDPEENKLFLLTDTKYGNGH